MKRLLLLAGLAAAGCGALLSPGDDDDLPPREDDAGQGTDATAATDAGSDVVVDAPVDATVDAPFDALPGSRLVFVSQGLFTPGEGGGGIGPADALCAAEHAATGRSGGAVAWMSKLNVAAIGRLTSNGPWTLATGTVVFPNRTYLATGNHPLVGINRDALGAVVTATINVDNRVWTGTNELGVPTASDCSGWTTTAAGGSYGTLGIGGAVTWTRATDGASCTEAYHVICFEP